MYLKRIELHGFKSFAGSKDIELGPGVTGIVGPNGSGKSNICDAIRWVLGEQSSRTLRGTSLQDVIFKGTQSRPKRNVCEVSLVFDNADGRLDLPYTEVSVTRSINRAGDSGFRINGADCRLRDILALFQNTGVGRDGYSIIGQGQISHILEHRASERRGVFDEAAGIMKLRTSKEEAERNLEKTQANTDRLRDILNELNEQLGPVREQMERAKEYLALNDELTRLEVTMLLTDREAAQERRELLEGVLAELEAEKTSCEESLTKITAQVEQASQKLEDERANGRALLDRLGQSGRENERQRGKAALFKQKIEAVDERLSQIAEEDEARASSSAKLTSEQLQMQKLKEETEKVLETLKAEEERLKNEDSRKDASSATLNETNLASLRSQVDRAERESRELRITAANSTAQRNTAREQLSAAKTLHQQQTNALKTADVNWDAAQRAWQTAHERHDSARDRFYDAQRDSENCAKELREAARHFASASAHADVLAQAQQAYDGYYDGVRALMRDAAENDKLASHIIGVVGESIHVPSELETAIEVALGAGLQNVAVPHDSDARELVRYLRKNRCGRVTFLPADALRTRYLNAHERQVLREEGCVGAANEAVKCADAMRPAVDYLLARTVIVEDLDTALRIKAAGRNTFRIVTLQGDVVATGGAITGGSTERGRRSFLARRRQAEDATENAQAAKREQERLAEKNEKLEAVVVKRSRELSDAVAATQIAREQLEAATAQKKAAHEAALRSEAEAARREKAYAAAAEQEVAASQRAHSAQDHYDRLLMTLHQKEADHEQLRQAAADAAVARAGLETRIAENAAQMSGAWERLRMYEERSAQIERSLRDAAAASEKAAALKESLAEQRRSAESALSRVTEDAASSEKTTGKIKLALDASTRAEKAFGQLLSDLEQKRSEYYAKERTAREQVLRTQSELEKLAETMSQCAERLWSDHELTIANAEPYRVDPFDRRRAKTRLTEIKAAIGALGPVNPQASDDFRRLNERSEQYTSQLADLEKAADDLRLVIDDLLGKMRRIFLERFAMINENFGRIFRELFGGGKAHIELTDDKEVMSAGIEILAEPPGKKLQSLSLLSGGERTLTAIALCLAMLAVNPSPVCILDEIDAPLDDKNAIRLAEYLHRVSGELQFIIITHRKTTMAVCDALYGVSMPEKGVSDIVSVRLG